MRSLERLTRCTARGLVLALPPVRGCAAEPLTAYPMRVPSSGNAAVRRSAGTACGTSLKPGVHLEPVEARPAAGETDPIGGALGRSTRRRSRDGGRTCCAAAASELELLLQVAARRT